MLYRKFQYINFERQTENVQYVDYAINIWGIQYTQTNFKVDNFVLPENDIINVRMALGGGGGGGKKVLHPCSKRTVICAANIL